MACDPSCEPAARWDAARCRTPDLEAEARRLCEEEADGLACLQLGGTRYTPRALALLGERDEARERLVKACTLGGVESCYLLRRNYHGYDEGPTLAALCQERSHGPSCSTWAERLALPESTDPAEVLEFHDLACELGEALSCEHVGTGYQGRDEPRANASFRRSIGLCLLACDECDPFACEAASKLIRSGRGITADDTRADELHDFACELHPEQICQWTVPGE